MSAFIVKSMAADDPSIWVWSATEKWLWDSMKGTYCQSVTELDEVALGLTPEDYQFIMPKDVQALHDRLRELAGVPRLNQMVRGQKYRHMDLDIEVQFIASHPDDGAYLVCVFHDEETDENVYIGCEASDLRFIKEK